MSGRGGSSDRNSGHFWILKTIVVRKVFHFGPGGIRLGPGPNWFSPFAIAEILVHRQRIPDHEKVS